MSYLVLARKYRPQTFEDVVEQAHVTRTLTNAIRSGRVAHAILFSGPRGTGKTTIARILAKAMNCEKGPLPVPCNTCTSCREITGGSAVDVFEIDGASNNGVDHIRDLRDNVKYMPAHSRYKIYIIDEVHMLSTPAFNALLKTLEEPPAHILFMFATTEPHKIPITILSRCQQHHLRRINPEDVARHMGTLCREEGVAIPDESLSLIARETGGSMRDALSLLDQVMTCSEGEITHEGVLNILGVADREVMFRITESIFAGNVPDILDVIDDIYQRGHDIKAFFGTLMTHFRNLWVVKTVKNAARLMDLPPGEIERMAALVRNVSEVYLSQILDAFTREESAVKFANQPRLALEMAFIRLFQIKPALPIETLIEKLDDLARRVETHPSGAPGRPYPAAPQVREPGPPAMAPPPASDGPETARSTPPPSTASPAEASTPEIRVSAAPEAASPAPEDALRPTPPGSGPEAIPEARPGMPAETVAPPEPIEDAPAECRLPDPSADNAYHPDDALEATWEKLTSLVCGRSSALGSYLTRTTLERIGDGEIEIGVQGNAFNLKQIQKKQDIIEEAARAFFGRDCRVLLRIDETGTEPRQKKIDQANTIRQHALNHPVVEAAMEIFDGKVVDIKIL